jgi:hypothetical protein
VYHYTSLGAFMEIVRSGQMYATDIRYLNDSAEMLHALSLVQKAIASRSETVEIVLAARGNVSSLLDPSLPPMMLSDLDEQLRARPCYATCFTKNGNQLSQWRGYCPLQKGISIGFNASDLQECGEEQGFVLRECVYDAKQQSLVGDQLLNALKFVPEPHDGKRRNAIFFEFQRIAAVLKHPRFAEEQECRLVFEDWMRRDPYDLRHREGKSMLIPYRAFHLPRDDKGRLKVAKIIVGPTPHAYHAVLAVRQFMAIQGVPGIGKVEYCDIPLREA